MEKTYKHLWVFLSSLFAIVIVGFYRSYFSLFPNFSGLHAVQHVYGFLLFTWYVLFIIQPLLIHYKKYHLHRLLGKVSYVLAPLVLVSLLLVTKSFYIKLSTVLPKNQLTGFLGLDFSEMIVFAALYLLAVINRRNMAYHMRYMIALAVLMTPPAAGRIPINYAGISFSVSIVYSMIFTEIITIALLLYDFIQKKTFLKPYVIALSLFIAMHLLWYLQFNQWWQQLMNKMIVNIF